MREAKICPCSSMTVSCDTPSFIVRRDNERLTGLPPSECSSQKYIFPLFISVTPTVCPCQSGVADSCTGMLSFFWLMSTLRAMPDASATGIAMLAVRPLSHTTDSVQGVSPGVTKTMPRPSLLVCVRISVWSPCFSVQAAFSRCPCRSNSSKANRLLKPLMRCPPSG